MAYQHGRKWRSSTVVRLWGLVLIMIAVGFAEPWAGAEALMARQAASPTLIGGDGHSNGGRIRIHSGNGKFNKNYSTVLSPTVNRGFQQVSNTNVSGKTATQVGFCTRKHHVCKISQRLGISH